MNEIEFLRAQVARERERLLGGLESARSQAAAAYLSFAMQRALARDRAHAARLETRLLPGDAAAIEAIAALRASFDDRDRARHGLEEAATRVARGDTDGAEALARSVDAAALAHAGVALRWQALDPVLLRHYLIEDWRATTLIDADAILEERALHAAWIGATPT
jgi:hypothetical protein